MAAKNALTTDNANDELVSVDEIEPADANLDLRPPVQQSERFIRNLDENGLEQPIIVDEDGSIVDGKRRWRAAMMLGYEYIEVTRRSYQSEEELRCSILAVHDTLNEPFIYKARAAKEYIELVAPALEERMKAGKPLDELDEDPLMDVMEEVEHPNMISYEGQSVSRYELAGEYVGWGPQKTKQALDILEEVDNGNEDAKKQIERMAADDVRESVNSAHAKLFPNTRGSAEDEQPDPIAPSSYLQSQYAFLPVLGFNEAQIAKKQHQGEEDVKTSIGGYELSWWTDGSITPKHPYLLVNAVGFTTVNPDAQDFREVLGYGEDHFVFADSGGYQLMSRDADAQVVRQRDDHDFQDCKIYPERLLEWQVENADAGASLDFAPYNISGDSSTPDAESFSENWRSFFYDQQHWSAKMTARMSSRLQELREQGHEDADDFLFCPVIQGKPFPEDDDPHRLIRQWHTAMLTSSKVDPDGWVLKPEPNNDPGQIAFWLGYATEELQEADYLHVLMVGSPLGKALLNYYAMLSGQFVTSDSSSYSNGGQYRAYRLIGTAGRQNITISNRDPVSAKMENLPCDCRVCSTLEEHEGAEFLTEGTGSDRNAVMNLHNLTVELVVGREIKNRLQDAGKDVVLGDGQQTSHEFWKYIRQVYDSETADDLARAMSYVRVAHDEGLDLANELYRIPWSSENGRTIVRRDSEDPSDRPDDIPSPDMLDNGFPIYDATSVSLD